LRRTQAYDLPDFLDLHDLCDQLKRRVAAKPVKDAAGGVLRVLEEGGDPFVLAEGHKGAQVAKSHGVSIYFPAGEVNVTYGRLDFAKATRWEDFIRAMG
jgi:hypothetical protein